MDKLDGVCLRDFFVVFLSTPVLMPGKGGKRWKANGL